jgi:hypothetical protein
LLLLLTGWIVQRYIADPYLLRGHKFDLRVFVTVTSLVPLRVYVHHHGWANVADAPYQADTHLSHVTNAKFVEHVDPTKVHRVVLAHLWGMCAGTPVCVGGVCVCWHTCVCAGTPVCVGDVCWHTCVWGRGVPLVH